jgi:hypothetical protein
MGHEGLKLTCPLCDKSFLTADAMKNHLTSPRHGHGQELITRIEFLTANLKEAERAVEIYRRLAREDA